jgi:hypothetical protein
MATRRIPSEIELLSGIMCPGIEWARENDQNLASSSHFAWTINWTDVRSTTTTTGALTKRSTTEPSPTPPPTHPHYANSQPEYHKSLSKSQGSTT